MREGNLERIKKDSITEFIEKEIAKTKEDINPSPLRMVERKDLIPEVEEIFRLYTDGNFEAAQAKIESVNEKIAAIKNKDIRLSNETFFRSFDQDIPLELGRKQTEEERLKDNI